jgi:hypothetical protein
MNITLDQFKSFPFYIENANFYESILDSNKLLINNRDGFVIYMYQFNENDFDSHSEFGFYPNKLEKISKTVAEIKKIRIEDKLTEALEQLSNATTSLLSKQGKNEIDLDIYESIVKQVSGSMIKIVIAEKLLKLEMEITDLQRNLPTRQNPVITDSFIIVSNNLSNKNTRHDLLELPVKMRRHEAMNGLILPKTINQEHAKIWTGIKPGPRIGQGSVEIWKKNRTKWHCISSEITWIS